LTPSTAGATASSSNSRPRKRQATAAKVSRANRTLGTPPIGPIRHPESTLSGLSRLSRYGGERRKLAVGATVKMRQEGAAGSKLSTRGSTPKASAAFFRNYCLRSPLDESTCPLESGFLPFEHCVVFPIELYQQLITVGIEERSHAERRQRKQSIKAHPLALVRDSRFCAPSRRQGNRWLTRCRNQAHKWRFSAGPEGLLLNARCPTCSRRSAKTRFPPNCDIACHGAVHS
jgi:hypothetical protein